MPLPLIPLLLGGAALFAGGYGVKKGFDAKEDFDRAGRVSEKAQVIYDKAKNALDSMREDTQSSLKDLGKIKLTLYEKGIIPFVREFEKIKNIDFSDLDLNADPDLIFNQAEMRNIREIALKMADIVGGGASSLAGGALAGVGAFGGAGLLATASTGTAISALSGVAATNATLAWFGGGSLAAGGLGMAGGTMVLGGIVAAPVLLVGGLLLASKAEKAVDDAYSNLDKAEVAAESMKTARSAARAILRRVEELTGALEELEQPFLDAVEDLAALVAGETNYQEYSAEKRTTVSKACLFTKTVKQLLEVPVFDEEGKVTVESKKLVSNASTELKKIAAL